MCAKEAYFYIMYLLDIKKLSKSKDKHIRQVMVKFSNVTHVIMKQKPSKTQGVTLSHTQGLFNAWNVQQIIVKKLNWKSTSLMFMKAPRNIFVLNVLTKAMKEVISTFT